MPPELPNIPEANPCPHCRGFQWLSYSKNDLQFDWHVRCENCYLSGPIHVWNSLPRRPLASDPPSELFNQNTALELIRAALPLVDNARARDCTWNNWLREAGILLGIKPPELPPGTEPF